MEGGATSLQGYGGGGEGEEVGSGGEGKDSGRYLKYIHIKIKLTDRACKSCSKRKQGS